MARDPLRTFNLKTCLFFATLTAVAVIGLGEKFLDSRFKASAASTFMVTNAQDSGAGSLRQAILDANANAGPDVINFSIGSFQQTIVLSSLLPVITDPVTIDATTQPGFAGQPLIEVKPDGQVIGDGFKITGGNSVIRGLIINSFRGSGIVIETGGGNVIEGNYIGTDVTGTVQTANIQMGVQILSSNNNRVGGLTTAARNVISGNGVHGVAIATGAANNVVQGNYIGISRTGDFKVQNNDTGVVILNAPNNTIGGTTATARNVIAGNEVDVAAKKRLFRRLRAVTKFKAHFEAVLLPDPCFLHHFPDWKMRVRAEQTANLHRSVFRHVCLLGYHQWAR